jgi:transcriptional regulator with XRE-family HTH domain
VKRRRFPATFENVPKRLSSADQSAGPPPELAVAELSRLLRERRVRDDLSIRQAAASARVSFSTLSRVEAGAQPDLATFTSLCGWLGVSPAQFFAPVTSRSQTPLDEAIEHLVTDPALSPDAAEQIASVMRSMYQALAAQSRMRTLEPMAVHLRAASVMRPGVPERLASLIKDMREALEDSGRI